MVFVFFFPPVSVIYSAQEGSERTIRGAGSFRRTDRNGTGLLRQPRRGPGAAVRVPVAARKRPPGQI